MIIQFLEFSGEAPRWHPRVLGDGFAQQALLTKFDRRTLAPYKQTGNVFVPSKAGTMQTIYRFGQDTNSDTSYWFHWPEVVSVIRSPTTDATDERTYYFGDGAPKVTDESLALSGGGTDYPINYYLLGLPRPGAASTSVAGTPTSDVPDTRVYAYTYVTAWGEEGPPSLPSAEVDVKPGETATVDISAALPSGAYNIAFKRIYRTSTGASSTAFLFVAEVPATDVSYVDIVETGALGELMQSTTWEQPPSDLVGAVLMPNGVILAWRENELWMCEPFVPHAFPPEYTLATDSKIVGVAVSGMTAVVVTHDTPYLVSGVHPDSMTMERLDIPQAGVSQRAVIPVMGGVAYASPDGIVFDNGRQPEVITKDLFRREDWQALNPSSMHFYVHENRLFCFYDATSIGGDAGGFLIDFFGETQSVVRIGQYYTAGYVDQKRDALFLCGDVGALTGAGYPVFGTGSTTQATQAVWGEENFRAVRTTQARQTVAGVGKLSYSGAITTAQVSQGDSASGTVSVGG